VRVEQAAEEPIEGFQLSGRQGRERVGENLTDDPVAGLPKFFPLGGETVSNRAPWPRDSFYEAPFGHACRERPEGLIGLECQLGQVVQARLGVLVEVP
jgi:hypothetical protein